MKRIVALFLVIAMAATFAFSAFADSQSEKDRLIKAIKDFEVTLKNGSAYTFKTTDINQAIHFLSGYDGEVTADMVDTAIAKLNEAKAIVKNANVSDVKNLSEAQKQDIIETANEAVEAFDLSVSVDNKSNKVEFNDAEGNSVYETSSALKKTGLVSPVYAVAGFVVVALVGCAVVTKKYALSK